MFFFVVYVVSVVTLLFFVVVEVFVGAIVVNLLKNHLCFLLFSVFCWCQF